MSLWDKFPLGLDVVMVQLWPFIEHRSLLYILQLNHATRNSIKCTPKDSAIKHYFNASIFLHPEPPMGFFGMCYYGTSSIGHLMRYRPENDTRGAVTVFVT